MLQHIGLRAVSVDASEDEGRRPEDALNGRLFLIISPMARAHELVLAIAFIITTASNSIQLLS